MNQTLKFILTYLPLVAGIVSTFLIVTNTFSCNCLNSWIFCDIPTVDLSTDSAKLTIIRSLLAKIALFLFLHAIIIMHIRIFTKRGSPATEEDPETIKVLNRIITNSIEQSIIFVGLYIYFLFDKAGDRFSSTELLTFSSWFLLSRVLFSITYIIGSIIRIPTLRAFGFALNLTVNVLLIELCFCPVSHVTNFLLGK